MIRLICEEKDFPVWRENPFAVRICGLRSAYGTDTRFALFWRQLSPSGKAVAWLSACDGDFTLDTADEADFEELAAFLQSAGGRSLLLPGEVSGRFSLTGIERLAVLRHSGTGGAPAPSPPVEYPVLYALLQSGGEATAPPLYEVWYPDLCHRIRHGAAMAEVLRDASGKPAAAAQASFLAPQGTLLSGVAVLPEERGQGFGRRAVGRLMTRLPAGRPVFALSRGETAGFYARLGFSLVGEAAAGQLK